MPAECTPLAEQTENLQDLTSNLHQFGTRQALYVSVLIALSGLELAYVGKWEQRKLSSG